MSAILPGVYTTTKKDGTIYYRSSLTYKRKHISLGSYPSPDMAHKAYQMAGLLLSDISYRIDTYHNLQTPLSFEKWVCLINLRDNGIYLSTPIYIRPKYFYYYLNENEYLTFDSDDLFYYSSHKIMRRGNHLFVADYGMQVNILARYGIHNFAVAGRDYKFINGDPHDFRYENVHIINRYFGVTKQTSSNGSETYLSHIHINGNYKIGTYNTEEEAAIAYNKAIDILKKKGCSKNHTPNFVELSNEAYANIYASLPISSKLEKLIFP